MQTKVQAYVQLADETALKITGNYLDWLSFLTTASRLYKYPYHDQLMIYAQRPDATPVPRMSSGTALCTATSGAAQRALPC